MTQLQPYLIRAEVIRVIRQFFREQNFREVQIPAFHSTIPLEPNLYPFTSTWDLPRDPKSFFLSTSPERTLKIMLAQGIGNCFGIGHCFRNLESTSTKHTPEFLMLEWYRIDANYPAIMHDVQQLIIYIKNQIDLYNKLSPSSILTYQNQTIDLSQAWPTLSLVDLFAQHANITESDLIDENKLFPIAATKGYTTDQIAWGALYDQIFLNEIEPHLPPSQPFFLTDFPSRMSPLCTPHPTKPHFAQRFELYIAGMELANGNTENTDVSSIQKVFEQESHFRHQQNLPTPPLDTLFLNSLLQLQSKSYAGIGLGLDRLAMLFADVTDISSFNFT